MRAALLALLLAGCAATPAPQTKTVCYGLAEGVTQAKASEMHAKAAAHYAERGSTLTLGRVDLTQAELQADAPPSGCDFGVYLVPRLLGPHMAGGGSSNPVAWLPVSGAAYDWQAFVHMGAEYHIVNLTTPTRTLIHELAHLMGCHHAALIPGWTHCDA